MTALGGLVEFFPYIVTWSDEDKEYVAICPSYPSLSYIAATEADALNGLKDLMADIDLDYETIDENLLKDKNKGFS